ncbi:MAG: hypothetical protein RR983_01455 [Massilia sp.]|uniref:hypothetical protein n=1 Tax=Massilia sp. TaxID=1882437 RepID=UPI002FCAF3E4
MLTLFQFKPSLKKFAQALMAHAQHSSFAHPMHFDADRARILTGANGDQIVNLANLHKQYCDAARADRPRFLEMCMAILRDTSLPQRFEDVRANLLPAVRARSYAESLRLSARLAGTALAGTSAAPLGEDVVTVIVVDDADSMSVVTATQLDAWGVSFAVALDMALDHLRGMPGGGFVRNLDGVMVGDWNDAYDSSHLLLPDVIHRAGISDPVAMIPTRDSILLAPAGDRRALLAMLALAHTASEEQGRTVSAAMYHFRNGSAQTHTPEDEEVARGLAQLRQRYLAEDYADQKTLLDDLHEKHDLDLFVASFMLAQDNHARQEFSLCTWSEGVDALLPKADRIALVRFNEQGEAQRAGTYDWDTVSAVAGHLMTPQPDTYPIRYRVTQFPDLALLKVH